MSGKSTAAVSQKSVSQKSVSPKAGASSHVADTREASARWAALDSRYERLVSAADAVLAELLVNRKDDRRQAS